MLEDIIRKSFLWFGLPFSYKKALFIDWGCLPTLQSNFTFINR